MSYKPLFLVLAIVWLLLAGCPSASPSQSVEIATPTAPPSSATEAPITPITPIASVAPVVVDAEPSSLALPTSTTTTETQSPASDRWATADPSDQSVVFWHRHNNYREKILNEIIKDFNDNNLYGIQVSAKSHEDYGAIFDATIGVLNTADSPNLVLGFQSDLATYFLSDGAIDLTPLIDHPQWGSSVDERADFYDWALTADRAPNLGNVQLGLSMDRAADVLFYNVDWLNELGIKAPPTTPDEFRTAACAAAKQPYSQTGSNIGFELANTASTFASWTFAFGGDIYDYETQRFTYDSEAALAAWTFIQGLINEGCATITSERFGDQTDFGNGVALFTVGSSSSFFFYKKAVEEGAGFYWQIVPLPHSSERPILNLSGASIAILKSTPEQELAAWLFLKHYASAEMQATWVRATNGFPIRRTALDFMGAYLDKDRRYASLTDLLPDGGSEPAVPGYGIIRGALVDAITEIAGGADVATTLAQLNAKANQVLEGQES